MDMNLVRLHGWVAMTPLLLGAITPDTAAAHTRHPATHPAATALSVMAYNVKGLPWPITSDRTADFRRIEARLRAMRAQHAQPHVIILQEAFTSPAKAIARRSGYRYIVEGPSRDLQSPILARASDRPFIEGASFFKGERSGKHVGSGLILASDYPILSVHREAFPAFACAGYDCLANKGILMVTVKVPGSATPVTVVTTHMNSKKSSGVSQSRSLLAYRRQVEVIDDFIARYRNPDLPVILAGDFNASSAERRSFLTAHSAAKWTTKRRLPIDNALQHCLKSDAPCGRAVPAIAATVFQKGRDWQFFSAGYRASIQAIAMAVPFGREHDGTMLSDHVGYRVTYRLTQALVPRTPRRRAIT